MIYHFALDGSIGAGKSTLIEQLKTNMLNVNQLPVVYLPEPVDLWQSLRNDVFDDNIIEKFYKNQSKYSFTFQVMALTTLRSQLRDIQSRYTECILITERSMYTSMYVFAQMLNDDNKMEKYEFDILNMLFDELTSEYDILGIIYLDVPVEVCYDRIIKRGRPGETIDLYYLNQLERYYKNYIKNMNTLEITDNETNKIDKIRSFIFERTTIEFLNRG